MDAQLATMPVGNEVTGERSHSYVLRKGIEGYIIGHTWQTERQLSDEIKAKNGGYPQWDYHSEEFAYTSKADAIAKLVDLVA